MACRLDSSRRVVFMSYFMVVLSLCGYVYERRSLSPIYNSTPSLSPLLSPPPPLVPIPTLMRYDLMSFVSFWRRSFLLDCCCLSFPAPLCAWHRRYWHWLVIKTLQDTHCPINMLRTWLQYTTSLFINVSKIATLRKISLLVAMLSYKQFVPISSHAWFLLLDFFSIGTLNPLL